MVEMYFFVILWSHALYQANWLEMGPYGSFSVCTTEAAIAAFEFQGAQSTCYGREVPRGSLEKPTGEAKARAEEEFLRYGP